ncbi:MAG TPA: hypothetical protein VFP91_16415 [Vicinamibacterales bacterium]|nr:hypothetical protein [Vicinamibacterales bacterium]
MTAVIALLTAVTPPAVCVAQDVDALNRVADEFAAKGLPSAPLTNKIREGVAKGVDPKRIELVIRQMGAQLESADRLIREMTETSGATRDAAVVLVAESLGSGVTVEQVRELHRLAQPDARRPVPADAVASAVKGLSIIEDAKLPVADGTAVMAETVKHGFRSNEILDVAREIKRRELDYRSGRASLAALRDAIARGNRPEQLFRDGQSPAAERPAATTRPERPVERPAARPDTQRPEQPAASGRPAR